MKSCGWVTPFAWWAVSTMALAADSTMAAPVEDHFHTSPGQDIVVTGVQHRQRFTMPTAISTLDGAELSAAVRPSIGETLSGMPGVSATFFGPNASRPILRGMDGDRVRVLTDGIGSFDVSNTSADHAVAINPLLAERVEVVRGPAALAYGASVIAGVVNVTDRRIPRAIPDEPVHLDAAVTYGLNARERSAMASADIPLGDSGLVVHADGSYLRTGNYRAGGHVFSSDLRRQVAAIGGEDAAKARQKGQVANSDARNWEAGGGLAWIGDDGSMGVVVSHMENAYGVPSFLHLDEGAHDHGHDHNDHAHTHDNIRLDLKQTRVDARAEALVEGGLVEKISFRFGFADYHHDEIEADGEIGTSFFNRAAEARLEVAQTKRGAWSGATGVQYLTRQFRAEGEEAYIAPNTTSELSVFTSQQLDFNTIGLEAGARYERQSVLASTIGMSRDFNIFSGAVGASAALADDWRLGLSLAWAERGPSAEELLANGPHMATNAVEYGSHELRKERSLGVEAVLRGRGEGWQVELSGFFSRFHDFLYLAPTGGVEHGLDVFQYRQGGARHWGFEFEGKAELFRMGEALVRATGMVDFVRADLLDGGPVPRIPPLRLLGGVEVEGAALNARIEVEHVARARHLALNESRTPAFTLVNASANWRPWAGQPVTLSLSLNNIFDVEARRHSSFLKDVAPLSGRDLRLSARFSF